MFILKKILVSVCVGNVRKKIVIYNTKNKMHLTLGMCLCWRHAKKKYSWMHNSSSCCNSDPFMERSLLPATVSAQDVVTLGEEAASHQRHGALQASEALAVPLALLKRDVLGPCQTCTHHTKIHIFTYFAG